MRRLGKRQRIYLRRIYHEGALEAGQSSQTRIAIESLARRGYVRDDDGVWVLTRAGRQRVEGRGG